MGSKICTTIYLYEDPIGDLNSNSDTFLYCQIQFETLISDQFLELVLPFGNVILLSIRFFISLHLNPKWTVPSLAKKSQCIFRNYSHPEILRKKERKREIIYGRPIFEGHFPDTISFFLFLCYVQGSRFYLFDWKEDSPVSTIC